MLTPGILAIIEATLAPDDRSRGVGLRALLALHPHPMHPLLRHMSQLVPKQRPPNTRTRRQLPVRKAHVRALGHRQRTHARGTPPRPGIRPNLRASEVNPEVFLRYGSRTTC
jgi:hypothetical protein